MSRLRSQIDADEPQDRLVDHAEDMLRSAACGAASAARTARSTETFRTRAPSG